MTDQIVKLDDNTLVRYKTVEERIDIGDLQIELNGINEQLNKVLDDSQLLEWARQNYQQPQNISALQARRDEILALLEIV